MSVNSQFAHVLQLWPSGSKYLIHQHTTIDTEDDGFGRISVTENVTSALSAYSPTNQPVIATGADIDEVLQTIKHENKADLVWIGMAEHDGDRYTIFHGA